MRSRPGSEVATWSALVEQKRRRDMDMMSRHGWQCGRSRHGFFGVATWKAHCGQKRCRDMNLMSRHRVASRRVATWFWCRDLDRPGWCRDTDLMS